MTLFTYIPLWLVLLLTALLILACIEGGYRIGLLHKNKHPLDQKPERGASVGTLVQIQLGLVAFLIAFTFGFAAQRFCERRALIIDEANAIGTTFLRADFLPDANEKAVKELLRQYVALRLNFAKDARQNTDKTFVEKALRESERLQQLLWKQTTEVGRTHDSEIMALFVSTVNDTIDLHGKRVSAERYGRIPDIIWFVMYSITLLGMVGVGYQFGICGARSWTAISLVVLSFSMVLAMIADLDRPLEGFFISSQKPLADLQRSIGEPSP
jgi:hypothetical protein